MSRESVRADLRAASARQLWRLNSEGVLLLNEDPDLWRPDFSLEAVQRISATEADAAIKRLLAERFPGLKAFPRRGETWTYDAARGIVELHGSD